MKQLDLRVAEKYRLLKKIGGGSFGAVYIATEIQTGNEVAIKLEDMRTGLSLLKGEVEVYKYLAGGAGIPRVHQFLDDCGYYCMVFDLLGPSLEDLFQFCSRRFSLKTVLMLADQLLHRLEFVHSRDIIHRDIKPANCLMGMGKQGNVVYITDLGIAADRQSNAGRPPLRPELIGTARYASVNGHLGVVQHRGDDLESLGYMLLYFLNSSLPWQGLKAKNHEEREQLILKKKQTLKAKDLCKGLPKEFVSYFKHIRSLGFDDTPNYSRLRKSFRKLYLREGYADDNVYDWTVLKYMQAMESEKMKNGVDANMDTVAYSD